MLNIVLRLLLLINQYYDHSNADADGDDDHDNNPNDDAGFNVIPIIVMMTLLILLMGIEKKFGPTHLISSTSL